MTEVRSRTGRMLRSLGVAAVLLPVVGAAMWPVTFESREEVFDIPKGTWARRMAGQKHEILPSEIRLMTDIHNVLLLKNSDDVPQIFGPTMLMPGQTLRLPFSRPSENYFACTAHASGQLLVIVEANPVWPWSRLGWRARRMWRAWPRDWFDRPRGRSVSYAEARAIVDRRCVECHAERPVSRAFPVAPQAVMLDTPQSMKKHAGRIKVRVVEERTMPIANLNGMTEEEREILGGWVDSGAPIP